MSDDVPNNTILAWCIGVLVKVGRGEVDPVLIGRSWDDVFAGDVIFEIPSGYEDQVWRVVVFNDCDSWDYIDHVISPHGDKYDVNFEDRPDPVQVIWWVDPGLAARVEQRFIEVGKNHVKAARG